jgi:hypothetical protein
VGHQPNDGAHRCVRRRDQPEGRQLLGPQRRDRFLDALELYVVSEQEEPCENRERVAPVEPAQVNGRVDRTRRELVRSEPLLDPVRGVAAPLERNA